MRWYRLSGLTPNISFETGSKDANRKTYTGIPSLERCSVRRKPVAEYYYLVSPAGPPGVESLR